MHVSTILTALMATGLASAARFNIHSPPVAPRATGALEQHHRRHVARNATLGNSTLEDNPFTGRKLTINPEYNAKLESIYDYFQGEGDAASAAKVRAVQDAGMFYWISNVASLPIIDDAIAAARSQKEATGEDQIVGLVLYDLPDRDCSAGESSGEFTSADGGLDKYKSTYVAPFAQKVASAPDVNFAIIIEPDALANLVTNMGVELCAQASPVYQDGMAYAIANLQLDNAHLYIDAANGGWLGWDDNLAPAAEMFANVLELARQQSSTSTKVRGFSTNVSNYNPFNAAQREPYTEYSNSWDESHYASSLAPHLEAAGLPTRFIIDQGRVANFGAREEWGDWCNVAPAGYGQLPGSPANNTLIDSIVWVKPGGESDGACGLEGAPPAGQWFAEYATQLIVNADASIA